MRKRREWQCRSLSISLTIKREMRKGDGVERIGVWVRRQKRESVVVQSCLTLCYPMECNPPGSLSMKFSRQEYRSGLPFPSPGDLPNPGIETRSLALQADSFLSEPYTHE